jgi:truncated hemoglobin YjbI
MRELGFGIPGSLRLRKHHAADAITAEERAEWLIDYVLSHQDKERTELIRRAVDQFLAAEAATYERRRRARWRMRLLQRLTRPAA